MFSKVEPAHSAKSLQLFYNIDPDLLMREQCKTIFRPKSDEKEAIGNADE
jgi:hypothetical protein